MDFVRDFFFTDIPNHVEFLKWSQTLDKNDDVLLIGILERLASSEVPKPLVPFCESVSSYGSVELVKSNDGDGDGGETSSLKQAATNTGLMKNPLHITTGYSRLQDLDDHEYNIFEYAYLATDSSWRTRAMAYTAATIQITFLTTLIWYNVFEQGVIVTPEEGFFDEVAVIMVVSTVLIAITVRSQFQESVRFNRTIREMTQTNIFSRRWNNIFLALNLLINQVVCICIFFFNIYFILVSDTPTEAVLNSVALAFIIEIDDYFKPNWDDDTIEDATAQVLKYFVMEPFSEEEVVVHREGLSILNLEDDCKRYVRVNPSKPLMNTNNYADVGKHDSNFTVSVYSAQEKDPESNVTTSYEQTIYHIGGTRVVEFHKALLNFHCLDNLEDFEFSTQV